MLVSVIIPYYKKQKFINKTIYSVLNQTYSNFEIIIVNDEPGHFSKKYFKFTKKDKRIKIISNHKNIGAGLSRIKQLNYQKENILLLLIVMICGKK